VQADIMSADERVDALLDRLAAGELPDNVRQAAARGALPLPTADLMRVQVFLATRDPSDEVRDLASRALADRDAEDVVTVMADAAVSDDVADYFAGFPGTPAAALEALAQNAACPEEALNLLASRDEAGVLDRLLRNEVLLIRCPASLGILQANGNLSPAQRDRLAEIRVHFVERPLPHVKPDDPPLEPDVTEQVVEAMVAAEDYERDPSTPSSSTSAQEQLMEEEDTPEKTAFFRILDMSTAEKVKLAFLGTPEERAILIRDSNRVVATSVLRSPRVSERDVEAYANMRSLTEEQVVIIANKRDWIRNYQVMLGVIRHPKTPPRLTMNFLPRVQDRDLKLLSKDRNLPEMTRQQVRRAFLARTQRKSPRR
jgi:hypothetical protein